MPLGPTTSSTEKPLIRYLPRIIMRKSMARLYSNENFPLDMVIALRQLGHDALTSKEAGQANQAC